MTTEVSFTDLTAESTISEILSADRQAGEMLESLGLHPQNHMDETLTTVCSQNKWSENEILNWLKKHHKLQDNRSKNEAYPGKNLTQWCKYIEEYYHKPIQSLREEINREYPRVSKVHGHQFPWLKNVRSTIQNFDHKLQTYTQFEKETFFPLLKTLHGRNQQASDDTLRQINKSIKALKSDQEALKDLITEIESKGVYTHEPARVCASFRIMTTNMKQLFSLLREQINVERERVFPLVQTQLAST